MPESVWVTVNNWAEMVNRAFYLGAKIKHDTGKSVPPLKQGVFSPTSVTIELFDLCRPLINPNKQNKPLHKGVRASCAH